MKMNTELFDRIFTKVKPLLRSGRPGDYAHIKSVYRTLVRLCENEKYPVNFRVLISAGILHDCGFGFLKKEHMHYFTGQKKVVAMKKVIGGLTLAYIPVCLHEFQFSDQEIDDIKYIVRYSDESVLPMENPSLELQILHDLNLYDRFLPHRLKILNTLYPDPVKRRAVLEDSLKYIILPTFRKKAEKLMKKITAKF
ncbi:MAG: hypothetical protein A3G09_01025 [Candidatus Moranbacteria bacterium RIFCSPLOWO2_12_FULL_48_12]|nr:MAG: hypothetical protein A3G09_01025 [Candidatus Moranbacteria bacterium RIFCSPLOWO2_12_FULL_48_12]